MIWIIFLWSSQTNCVLMILCLLNYGNNFNFVDDYCLFFQGSMINFRETHVNFAE
jgi:hypothetical protein